MPANGIWDLNRRLKVNATACPSAAPQCAQPPNQPTNQTNKQTNKWKNHLTLDVEQKKGRVK